MEKLLTVFWYDQRKIYSVGEVPGKGAGNDGSLFGRNPPNRKANAQAFKGKFKRSSKKILVLVVRGAEQMSPLRMMQEA